MTEVQDEQVLASRQVRQAKGQGLHWRVELSLYSLDEQAGAQVVGVRY